MRSCWTGRSRFENSAREEGMTRPQATATMLVEDATVRVTRFDFAPGAETGWQA